MDSSSNPVETGLLPIETAYPVEFTATAAEYFRIWIVNLALTIATLGIYSAWAKVRKLRYLYGHTRIAGEPFEYRGRPLPILKGRLVAVALIVLLVVLRRFLPRSFGGDLLARIGFVIVAACAGPWLLVRTLKFNAYSTAWRNIRLRFTGTYNACLDIVLRFVWIVLVPVAYPWFKRRLVKFVAENHFYGATQFKVGDFRTPFINAYLAAYGLYVFGLVLITSVLGYATYFHVGNEYARSGASLFGLAVVLAIYVLTALIATYLRARTVNALWNYVRIGPVRFESTLRARDLVAIYAVNAVAIMLTLGLATPWAVIRARSYRASRTTALASAPLDAFADAPEPTVNAVGEEIDALLGFDIAL